MESTSVFAEEIDESGDDLYSDFDGAEDDLIERTKIAMVLGAFEAEITRIVFENIEEIDLTSGASKKAFNLFQDRFHRKPNSPQELVRSASMPILISMAQQAMKNQKKKDLLTRLSELCGALQIAQTRNKTYHANNIYNPVYWIRVQALAMDPVIGQLEMTRVIERCKAAQKGELEDLGINLQDQITTIPNNLPSKDFQELIGRSTTQKEIRDSLLNPRKSSISVYGSGGLGKTACVLDVLGDLSVSEAGPEHFDYILYSSLKNEFLEAGRIIKKDVGLTLDDVKVQLLKAICTLAKEDNVSDLSTSDKWEFIIDKYSDQRIVIWVDNLETLQEDIYDAFSSFEDSLPRNWKLVVTSRIRTRSASSIISLKQLDLNSAAKLLSQEYKIGTGEKIDFSVAQKRADELFCNPLAIKNTISYLKLSGKSLNESVKVSKDAIVSFSYERIVESLSVDCKRLIEILFVTDGTTQYEASKMTGLNIDDISDQFSNIRDLGLTSTDSDNDSSINLNSNFRSYLVLHPISQSDRETYKLYLEDQQYESDQSVSVKENSHSNPLRFSHISSKSASNPTLMETLSEGIGILGRAYKIQKDQTLFTEEEVDSSNNSLRSLCNDLIQTKEMIQVQEKCPPEVNRLLGLIYEVFNSDKESIQYLEEGAQDHDLVCLRNLFTIYSRTNPSIAIDYGIKLFRSIPQSLDNDDCIKLITAFYQCLCKAKKMPVFAEIFEERKTGRPQIRSLISVLRAESLIESAKIIQMSEQQKIVDRQERFAQLTGALHLLVTALDSLEMVSAIGLYSMKLEGAMRKWLDASLDLLKAFAFVRERVAKSFIASVSETYVEYKHVYLNWKEYCLDNGTWSESRESRITVQCEQLDELENILNSESSELIDVYSTLSWFRRGQLQLNFLQMTGLDDRYALFEDPSTGFTYFLDSRTFNNSGFPTKDLKWGGFHIGRSYKCTVYLKHYFLVRGADKKPYYPKCARARIFNLSL